MRLYKMILFCLFLAINLSCTNTSKQDGTVVKSKTTFPEFRGYPKLNKEELKNRFFYFSRDRSSIACNMITISYIESIPDSLFNTYYIVYDPIRQSRYDSPAIVGYTIIFINRETFELEYLFKVLENGSIDSYEK